MNIIEIGDLIKDYTEPSEKFEIRREIFDNENGKSTYNATILEKVKNKCFGIYAWVNRESQEVIYIGMAGKIKNNGEVCEHHLSKRLRATRGRDKATKLDILTHEYLKFFMTSNNVNILDFHIFYTKKDEPAAYVEALILYNYFKKNKRLPILNNSF